MNEQILAIINEIRANKGYPPLQKIALDMDLKNDLGMDSLDLAELTVRVESKTSVDIFASGIVNTVGEILEKLK